MKFFVWLMMFVIGLALLGAPAEGWASQPDLAKEVDAVCRVNNLANCNAIKPGQVLTVRGAEIIVRKGDNLWRVVREARKSDPWRLERGIVKPVQKFERVEAGTAAEDTPRAVEPATTAPEMVPTNPSGFVVPVIKTEPVPTTFVKHTPPPIPSDAQAIEEGMAERLAPYVAESVPTSPPAAILPKSVAADPCQPRGGDGRFVADTLCRDAAGNPHLISREGVTVGDLWRDGVKEAAKKPGTVPGGKDAFEIMRTAKELIETGRLMTSGIGGACGIMNHNRGRQGVVPWYEWLIRHGRPCTDEPWRVAAQPQQGGGTP